MPCACFDSDIKGIRLDSGAAGGGAGDGGGERVPSNPFNDGWPLIERLKDENFDMDS